MSPQSVGNTFVQSTVKSHNKLASSCDVTEGRHGQLPGAPGHLDKLSVRAALGSWGVR